MTNDTNALLYGGVKIFTSALATAPAPNRVHKKTRSMKDSYHARIQKKWVKRYGEKRVPGMYKTPFGFVVHPDVMAKLKLAINAKNSGASASD